jgi:hypothetical protein
MAAALPEALLDLSIRLSKAGEGVRPGGGHGGVLSAEATEARAEMLRLARERLTRGGSLEYAVTDRGLIADRRQSGQDPGARVLAELAWQDAVHVRGRHLVGPNGRVDLRGLAEEFGAFWREHGELPGKKGQYPRVAPDRVLLALLRRAVGAGPPQFAAGSVDVVFRDVAVRRSRRRVIHERADVLVRTLNTGASGEPAEQRAAIQVHELGPERDRRWYRGSPVIAALPDLDELLERTGLDSGILVLMDRRPRRGRIGAGRATDAGRLPDPRVSAARTPGGRAATIVAC